jgi:hypothetical protein
MQFGEVLSAVDQQNKDVGFIEKPGGCAAPGFCFAGRQPDGTGKFTSRMSPLPSSDVPPAVLCWERRI